MDGKVVDVNNSMKAESFNRYFSSVFTKEDEGSLPQLPDAYPSINAVEISIEGVT